MHQHETNAPEEQANEQVYDNTFSGKLSSTLFPNLTSEEKSYPGNVDDESKQDVYDQDINETSVYGNYY